VGLWFAVRAGLLALRAGRSPFEASFPAAPSHAMAQWRQPVLRARLQLRGSAGFAPASQIRANQFSCGLRAYQSAEL